MIVVFAHIGHWYSVFGFIVPTLLVIGWMRLQNRRERRRKEFVEDWMFELHDGEWVMVSMAPVPPPSRRRRAAPQRVSSPWLAQAQAERETSASPSKSKGSDG